MNKENVKPGRTEEALLKGSEKQARKTNFM